jgi:hypothetical protein
MGRRQTTSRYLAVVFGPGLIGCLLGLLTHESGWAFLGGAATFLIMSTYSPSRHVQDEPRPPALDFLALAVALAVIGVGKLTGSRPVELVGAILGFGFVPLSVWYLIRRPTRSS